jgi:hypothetical protein
MYVYTYKENNKINNQVPTNLNEKQNITNIFETPVMSLPSSFILHGNTVFRILFIFIVVLLYVICFKAMYFLVLFAFDLYLIGITLQVFPCGLL